MYMYTQNYTDYVVYMLGASHGRLLDLPEMFEVAFVVCFPTLIKLMTPSFQGYHIQCMNPCYYSTLLLHMPVGMHLIDCKLHRVLQ